MNERANNLKFRGILLGIIVLLAINISACTTLKTLFSQDAAAAAEAEAVPEEAMALNPSLWRNLKKWHR